MNEMGAEGVSMLSKVNMKKSGSVYCPKKVRISHTDLTSMQLRHVGYVNLQSVASLDGYWYPSWDGCKKNGEVVRKYVSKNGTPWGYKAMKHPCEIETEATEKAKLVIVELLMGDKKFKKQLLGDDYDRRENLETALSELTIGDMLVGAPDEFLAKDRLRKVIQKHVEEEIKEAKRQATKQRQELQAENEHKAAVKKFKHDNKYLVVAEDFTYKTSYGVSYDVKKETVCQVKYDNECEIVSVFPSQRWKAAGKTTWKVSAKKKPFLKNDEFPTFKKNAGTRDELKKKYYRQSRFAEANQKKYFHNDDF